MLALALLLLGAPAVTAAPATLPPLSLVSQSRVLDNGLTVIVAPDHSVPGVAVDVWYRVGSRDEEPGRTGFAHLFEHLMFMGARAVPYPKFDTLMEAAGGVNNASTANDRTNYWEIGPSNLLETFFWMEADRMASLGATMTDEKLQTQRLVVLNERRQSYENRPYGTGELAAETGIWPEGHPYSWPVIGSSKDLEAATLADVKKFFATFYVASNATLAVAGDVEPEQVFALAQKYFGFLPKRTLPARKAAAQVALAAEKRVALTDKVELPKVIVVWPSPGAYQPGDADADQLGAILGNGKASRLYQRLVKKDELATEVRAGQDSLELQSDFRIEAMARPGHTTGELLKAIDEELARFVAEGPSADEVDSARVRAWTAFAHSLEGLQPRAERLAEYAVRLGDANALGQDLARYAAVTRASVQALAKQVLVPGRLVVEIQPEAKTAEGGAR